MMTPPPTRDIPKIPSMWHLPSSQEHAREQDFMSEKEFQRSLIATEPTVVTEKLDGSNVRLTREAIHSRSRQDPSHESFDRLKARHGEFAHRIPEEIVLYGEWVYAEHSIHYSELSDYLHIFAAVDIADYTWLSWEATKKVAERVGVETVPVLDIIDTGLATLPELPEPSGESAYGPTREGYVARITSQFPHEDFKKAVAKSVRENHVQTDEHWKHQPVTPNDLAE